MSIPEDKIGKLRAFGYTEVEARFLYLVATHSGYFTLRQFLDFAHAKSGKRNARLVEKLFSLGHASARRYTRRSLVFQLRSRQIYSAIGKNHLRNRREHELLHIKTRLLALDFILAHPQERYFETAEEKRRYFIDRFNIEESLFSPTGAKPPGISFSDRFPLCVAYPPPEYMPVVTFTYIDPQHRKPDAYIAHLRTYRPLLRRLPSFQFVYISTSSSFHNEAAELFSFLVEGKGLSDLTRYFDFQTKWDRKQYGLLAESEVLFMSESRKRFTGPSIATLHYLWKLNRLPKDLQPEATPTLAPAQKILFRAVAVPGQKSIFGDSTKNWGDGWEIRGWAPVRSASGSPARATQSL
ncbi:MAG TPA: hypothetical protein VE778_02025 [Candidatus Bathyarchaeia archaeon]|jgi:hypothetical protein|nr:hypothetical protein [Candidatus Bathyarchaeia archaeon]